MFGRILRLVACLAVALNVTFTVPSLAFAHAQVVQASDSANGGEHMHAMAAQGDDCCDDGASGQPDWSRCHCDMGLCSPVLAQAPTPTPMAWIVAAADHPAPDDANQLSDLLPPLRPPRV